VLGAKGAYPQGVSKVEDPENQNSENLQKKNYVEPAS